MPEPAGQDARAHGDRWPCLVGALLVFVHAFSVWQSHGPMEFFPHMDMTASFMIARDCVEGRGCTMEILPNGAPSILGFSAGAIANHLAALVYAASGDFRGLATVVQAFFALAAALTFLAAGRHAGMLAGAVAYLVFMRSEVMRGFYTSHWYIVLYHFVPLFGGCFVLFGLGRARGGGIELLLLAALAASLAGQTHQTGLALVFPLLALAWFGSGGWRRLARIGSVVAVFVAAFGLGSYAVLLHFAWPAFVESLLALQRRYVWLFPAWGLALIAAAALLLLRPRRNVAAPRDLAFLACAVLPALPILLIPSINSRYRFPFEPAIAVLCGVAAGRAADRAAAWVARRRALRPLLEIAAAPAARLAVLVALVSLVPWGAGEESRRAPRGSMGAARSARVLGFYDLKETAGELEKALGGAYESAFARVRTPVTMQVELLGTMGVLWPLGGGRAADSGLHAAVLPSPPGFSLPDGRHEWSVHATGARHDVALLVFEPYVDTSCIAWRGAPHGAWRKTAYTPSTARLTREAYRWRMMPNVDEFAYPRDLPAGCRRLLMRFAVRVPRGGAARVLLLQNASAELSYAIERIEGAPFQGTLPAPLVVLPPSAVEREGFVEISATSRGPQPWGPEGFPGFPPPIFEIDADVFPLVAPLFRIVDEGHGVPPPALDLPALPAAGEAARFEPLRSLAGANGEPSSVRDYFRSQRLRSNDTVSDVTAPFPFVAAVMGLFGLALAAGLVRSAR